jgi:DNA-directed RNA polymerase subunit M/transcription elongation factor TFIIS
MTRTEEGFQCQKCGTLSQVKPSTILKIEKRKDYPDGVYVYENQKRDYARTLRLCPECGSKEAWHWFSGISGEHAGVRQGRTVEHFRCTKCSHTWTESS